MEDIVINIIFRYFTSLSSCMLMQQCNTVNF